MASLSVVYSKTPKGLRARASLIGGLSSHLFKVLSLIDGASKAETILIKLDRITEQELLSDLTQLEEEGYIKIASNTRPNEEWAPTVHFTPMVVEEFQSEEALEAERAARAEEEARKKAEAEAAAAQEAARIAAEKAKQLEEKNKAKAEQKVKAQLESERLTREAEEARKKAETEEKARLEAEAKANALAVELAKAEQARLDTERIAQEQTRIEAEKAEKALQEARERAEQAAREEAAKVQTEIELARIAREVEAAQRKAEAEVKARLEAEAKASALAAELAKAEQARQEAERAAQEEARKHAETEAKLAAEEKVKAEAAAKARAEQIAKEKEMAHLEIERVLREAEEKRKQEVAKAKEEKLEAKRKAKAEEEAKLAAKQQAAAAAEAQSQAQAQKEAQEQAEAQAQEESAQLELARLAREAEEGRMRHAEIARAKAEEAARIEAERIQARQEAEAAAEAAAIEKTRLEMARINQEAEALRHPTKNQPIADQTSKVETVTAHGEAEIDTETPVPTQTFKQTKAQSKARKKAQELDEEEAAALAEIEAEEAALKQAVQKNAKKSAPQTPKKVVDIEEVDAFLDDENELSDETDIEDGVATDTHYIAAQPIADKLRIRLSPKQLKRWTTIATKVTFVYLPIMLLLVLGVMHFINLKMLIPPMQKLVSESVGDAVTIDEVRASLLPAPHLVLQNMVIGTKAPLKIAFVHVEPDAQALTSDIKVVNSLIVEGVQLDETNFSQPMQWLIRAGKASNLDIKQIHLKDIVFKIKDLDLGAFDGKVIFSARALSTLDLISNDQTLKAQITPQGGNHEITLSASNWALPTSPKLVFSALNAKGIASQDALNFNQINGEFFGGNIKANMLLDWANGWAATGAFDLSDTNTSQLLKAFSAPISVDGKLKLTGNFASRTSDVAKLMAAANVTANFALNNGSLEDIELTRAVLTRGTQSLLGDATRFDQLTGSLQVTNGIYEYKKLALDSPQFRAKGAFNIAANQALSGKISADLSAQSRRLHANIDLAGTSSNVQSK